MQLCNYEIMIIPLLFFDTACFISQRMFVNSKLESKSGTKVFILEYEYTIKKRKKCIKLILCTVAMHYFNEKFLIGES